MNIENIVWADIKGYEGYYQVSNTGLVRSKNRIRNYCNGRSDWLRGKIMKPKKRSNGYQFVELSKNGKTKTFYIHRLVAFAFIPNPQNKPQVNHIDSCTNCNHVDNLEWCTPSENILHSYRQGKHSTLSMKSIKRSVFVPSCSCCYFSVADAAKELKISYGHLLAMLSGKRKNSIGIIYCEGE